MLGPDGSVVTPTFLVNTTTLGNQILPAVAGLTSGGFVIAWQDGSAAATTGQDIRAQAFTAAGTDSGAEFLVNTTTAGDQTAPSIAALANGDYVVEWAGPYPDQKDAPEGPQAFYDVFTAGGANVSKELSENAGVGGPDAIGYLTSIVVPLQSGFSIGAIGYDIFESDATYKLGAEDFSDNGNYSGLILHAIYTIEDTTTVEPVGAFSEIQLANGDLALAIKASMVSGDTAPTDVMVFLVDPGGTVSTLASVSSTVNTTDTSIALLGLANSDIVLAWTDSAGLHTGIVNASGNFAPVTYSSGSAPSSASDVELTQTPSGFLETWTDGSGAYQAQIFNVDFPTDPTFNPSAAAFNGVAPTTLSGTFVDLGGGLKGIEVFNGATDLGAATINVAAGTWSLTATLAAGAYTDLRAVATDLEGVTAEVDAKFRLTIGIAGQAYTATETITGSASAGSYETLLYSAGGSLYLAETVTPVSGGGKTVLMSGGSSVAAQNATSILEAIDANGEVTQLSYEGVSDRAYTAYQVNYIGGRYVGAVYDYSNITGQAYTSYSVTVNAAGQTVAEQFYGVAGEGYASYKFEFSPGGDLIGSAYFYPNEEVDLNGGGLTGIVYTDVLNYTSVKADYVGGVYAGSEYQVTAPAGQAYSSYEIDDDYANKFLQDKFFFTNVGHQTYSGLEEDFDATGNLSREIFTGVTGEGYTSLELDYSIGTYEGYKADYTGDPGDGYANKEVDVDAANQITKVVYAGLTSTPYSGLEQDYSGGALTDSIYSYTDVSGRSYYAYTVEENAAGAATQEVLDNNDGSHTIVGRQNNQTLTSIADDKMTGGGAGEMFVFNAIYGHDTITDFASTVAGANNDVISLAKAEFTNWQTLLADAKSSGANGADTTFTSTVTHDTLTLDGVTVAQLNALTTNQANTDFTFHA